MCKVEHVLGKRCDDTQRQCQIGQGSRAKGDAQPQQRKTVRGPKKAMQCGNDAQLLGTLDSSAEGSRYVSTRSESKVLANCHNVSFDPRKE